MNISGKGVYILQAGVSFKIGATECLTSRISGIQTGCPLDLRLILFLGIEENYKIEKKLHHQFSGKRIRGEWFLLNKEDINKISQDFGVELSNEVAYSKFIETLSSKISTNGINSYDDPFGIIFKLLSVAMDIETPEKSVRQLAHELVKNCESDLENIKLVNSILSTEKERILFYEQSNKSESIKREEWENCYSKLFNGGIF